MRRINIMHLCVIGILLLFSVYVFSGCSNDGELSPFSGETLQQETAEGDILPEGEPGELVDGEDAGINGDESSETDQIAVYLCGAVNEPGVIILTEGSRINDAVLAAGGFTEDAAVTSVNLAAKLEDGEMIYVLTEAEAGQQAVVSTEGPEAASEGRMININTADIYALCRLPGIGESKARDIITYREKNGAFQKKEDIMQVTGIKESLYKKICDLISVK